MQMLDSEWHDWSSLLQLTWYSWEENPVILFWPHALNPGSCFFHWCHKTIYLHAFHFSLKESKKETVTTKTCLQVSRWGKYIQKGTIYSVSYAALSVNFINCFPICMCKIQLKVDKGSFTKLAEKKKKPKSSLHVESFLLKLNCQYLQLKQSFAKHFHMFKKGALLIYCDRNAILQSCSS